MIAVGKNIHIGVPINVIYRLLFVILCCQLIVSAQPSETFTTLVKTRGKALMKEAGSKDKTDGKAVFLRFIDILARETGKAGDKTTASRLTRAVTDPNTKDIPKTELAWATHVFARECYKDDIIRETAELMQFKTYATDVPNRENPEFVKQKHYLETLAGKLGLNFRDVGGYVQEIWIGGGKESFGIMSHSDVQPVDEKGWSHDPWSGAIIDGKIWGRGSVDDKGPIVAVMYGMRALLDTRLPLQKKIILLVGTDEESANEDVATYLKTNSAPDQTIVVDSNFPVVCAEKGWCGVWLNIPRDAGNNTGKGLLVTGVQAGFSPSIVPEKAKATIVNTDGMASSAKSVLEAKAKSFMQKRKGSKITITASADTLHLTASGKSVHSASPEKGHNALMDLLVFLDKDAAVLPNAYGLMAKFASTYIGFELNGKSLGVAWKDDFMGEVSVSANMFSETDTTLMYMFNFRIPKGIDSTTIVHALDSRFEEFGTKHGFKFSDTRYISKPLYNDPESPFVQKLLGIYNSVTGEKRKAQSTGGGTYAKRIPNAVVFGPALPDEEYLGHRPDEYLKVSTLIKNIEILTQTLVEFGL